MFQNIVPCTLYTVQCTVYTDNSPNRFDAVDNAPGYGIRVTLAFQNTPFQTPHSTHFTPFLQLQGYEGENLYKVLQKLSESTVVMLDRWHIEFSDTATPTTTSETATPPVDTPTVRGEKSNGESTISNSTTTSNSTASNLSPAMDNNTTTAAYSSSSSCSTNQTQQQHTTIDKSQSEPGDPIPYNIINNYFSIGVVRLYIYIYRQ